MLDFKLAFRNLIGAGLRTWLNVTVLSIAFVVIVFYNGLLDGWHLQAKMDTKDWEIASGELRHPLYDPYDPYCLQDAHKMITADFNILIRNGDIAPVLITQGTAYPEGRMQNILIKGIDANQKIVKIPTSEFKKHQDEIPAIIGKRMAEMSKLRKGDRMVVRWRDANGTFDAQEVVIADIFASNVPMVDAGQIWLPLDKLQEMTGYGKEATYFIVNDNFLQIHPNITELAGWQFRDQNYLLKDINDVIRAKKTGSKIVYLLLLAIALLAIFDTQILSIFRRQKEIGTYIALGMTRYRVIRVFTIEGSANSIFAIILGMIYGTPIFYYFNKFGIPMPSSTDQMGISIGENIFPAFSMGLIISSIIFVIISATIVSYLPTRRISRLKPTDALRGKMI